MSETKMVKSIIAYYMIISAAWVALSDWALHGFMSKDTVKGLLFVMASAAFFYLLLRKYVENWIRARDRMQHLSSHDSWTGLPNDRYFLENLKKRLSTGAFHALCIVQIDQIDPTGGFYAREYKTRLMMEFSARLRDRLTPSDMLAVTADHTFKILLASKKDTREVQLWLTETIPMLKEPVIYREEETYPQIHIGVSFHPADGKDGETLIMLAYSALRDAKLLHKDVAICDEATKARLVDSIHLESDLRKAIAAGQFELYYQPKVCVKTGSPVGAEALLRWNHPDKGVVAPGIFVPFAEEYGLIVPIGEWVLRQACVQLSEWKRLGCAPIPISVNLSMRQFLHKDIVDMMAEALAITGVEPRLLVLEITESMTMDAEQAIRIMKKLKSLGVSISMDDFGTGYSSLANLRRFPLDSLKIDKSFIDGLLEDRQTREVIGAIIRTAHLLDLKVVAEGVETAEQHGELQALQCDELQGYLFGRPMPEPEFCRYMKEWA